ncbi:MAG: sulfurtransferase-like selenium metabolism protein YedF [Desulfobacula sp.]|uniref:sulfurtransferase-like selenium metabolism protein YedF n=1 Tax=Desulfobacula sp. TaxID=2593537 RepID=UPI0025B90868|nr:sulfurtransferase-like selenium metabolism protein YedF [Desulfobacula sp.]MCD4722836.1 sulfurtransferase-like selenium metabolism protein YedF [Desulfobacula sp.]
MKEIDVRGLACPAPVLQTKNAIEEENLNSIKVLVDNEAARQNVSRFLESQDFEVSVKEKKGNFYVTGRREGGVAPEGIVAEKQSDEKKKIMVMLVTDRMGFGDDELGLKLMISYIKTLKEMGPDLWRLVFVNNGVKLTVDGSDVLSILKEYEEDGLCILVCGTCLTHFDLLDQKQVGETTNMLDIVTAMQLADKVITI